MWNIHDIEVVGVDDVSREVSQDTEHEDYRHGYARKQSVDAICEIRTIRYGGDDEYRHDDVEYSCEGVVATSYRLIVERCVFVEWD